MMEVKHNAKEVAASFRKRFGTGGGDGGGGMRGALKKAWSDSGNAFVSKITTEQMTGRPGLKRPTGTLAKSWWSKAENEGSDLVLRSGVAKRAWYAIVHQTGKTIRAKGNGFLRFKMQTGTQVFRKDGGGKLKTAKRLYGWASVKEVKIPKRLHIPETWKSFTHPMLVRKTAEIIHRFAKGGK